MSVQLDMLDIIDERNFLDKELMVLAKRSKNHRDSCDVNVSRTQIHGKEIVEFLLNISEELGVDDPVDIQAEYLKLLEEEGVEFIFERIF